MVARCTCEHARREARAEAFREAAEWYASFGAGLPADEVVASLRSQAGRLSATTTRDAIVDCVEDDGFVTVHPPTWPSEDGGLDG